MPEAPMHEEAQTAGWEYEVGFPCKTGMMKPVAEPRAMQKPTDSQLRSRVSTTDASHDLAPALWRDDVHQMSA